MYVLQFCVCMHTPGGGSKETVLKIDKNSAMKTKWDVLNNRYYQTSLVIVILN